MLNGEPRELAGPTTVHVRINPDGTGASDTDGDGRDQARTVMTQLDLSGMSPMGAVSLRLRGMGQHPFLPTVGEIEEQGNAHPGFLDIRPFEPEGGLCNSFFDVFFEVSIQTPNGPMVLHNHQAKAVAAAAGAVDFGGLRWKLLTRVRLPCKRVWVCGSGPMSMLLARTRSSLSARRTRT